MFGPIEEKVYHYGHPNINNDKSIQSPQSTNKGRHKNNIHNKSENKNRSKNIWLKLLGRMSLRPKPNTLIYLMYCCVNRKMDQFR